MRTNSSVLCCGLVPLLWLCAGCGADGFERTGVAVDSLEWKEGAKLVAPEGTKEAEFGVSVAIDGDIAIVGAHSDDGIAENAGAAQVFVRKDNVWLPQQKIVASDAEATDGFGYAVAVSGDIAIIGAPNEDDPAENAGAAYIFVREGDAWKEQQKLVSPNPEFIGSFGTSVAISGNLVLVGASREDGLGFDSGAAYVFVRDGSGTMWGLQKKLLPADGAPSHFGSAVALSANAAVVGAPRDNAGMPVSVGAAYVFDRAEGAWPLEQILVADDAGEQDYFGASVAISGDTTLVGATGDDDVAEDGGAAYVFSRVDNVWSAQQKLVPSAPEKFGRFGMATSVAGDVALVGTYLSGPNVTGAGSAYVFVRESDVWVPDHRLLASDGADGDFFGIAVALSEGTAIVGAPGDDNDKGENAGSVYTFGALIASGANGAGGMGGAGGFDGVGGAGGAGARPNQATIGDDSAMMTGGCGACTAAGGSEETRGLMAAMMALGMAFVGGRRRSRLNARGRRGSSSDRAARRG
ncbi:FG-GAP repeat protein [Polyangium mundeleinium]|uniref:FG-GAP repeat protein n=1 Tax=Polyangium mundeleinium TaxID=2995306 RepID=A0ABT5EGG5_9BACT|nr:FG-GAP repeat protein [Polyangium mundeleinium]MDC0739870.1 FG-GAP repeat protein [Polyangium mundeleinium]